MKRSERGGGGLRCGNGGRQEGVHVCAQKRREKYGDENAEKGEGSRTESTKRQEQKAKYGVKAENIAPPEEIGVEQPDEEEDEQAPRVSRHACARGLRPFQLKREADPKKKRENRERFDVNERRQGEIDRVVPARGGKCSLRRFGEKAEQA